MRINKYWAMPVALVWLIFGIMPLFAARVFIPKLELFFGGNIVEDRVPSFNIIPEGELDIVFDTGSKVGAEIGLGFDGELIEERLPLDIELLALHVGRPVEDEIYLTLFHGELTDIGSGEDFPKIFNSRIVAPAYRGRRFFSRGQLYEGLYTVQGTGLEVGSEFGGDNASLHFYAYRDARVVELGIITQEEEPIDETYGFDTRLLIDTPNIKFDLYAGMNLGLSDTQFMTVRGGVMMFIDSGGAFELYTHIGLPWLSLLDASPGRARDVTLDSFQFLIEPRFILSPDFFSIYLTAFWDPNYYNNKPRENRGLDLNTKLLFGSFKEGMVHGGIDLLARLSYEDRLEADVFEMSPFLGISGAGVLWEFALRFAPFQPLEDIQVSIGATTTLE